MAEAMNFNNIKDIMQKVEQIKGLSTLLTPDNKQEVKMAESPVSSVNETRNNINNVNSATDVEEVPPEVKKLNIINAALPFLDKRQQKNFSVALKAIELRNISRMPLNDLESQSITITDINQRREKILSAVRTQLNSNEQKDLDMLVRFLEMKKLIGNKKQGEEFINERLQRNS